MNYFKILEYKLAVSQSFTPLNFTDGIYKGLLAVKGGHIDVYSIENDLEISYGAFEQNQSDLSNPLAFLSFEKAGSMLFSRNAWTAEIARGRGIQSSLFLFVNREEGFPILSDSTMSVDGEALWKSLINSGKFKIKIANIKSQETFDFSEIGNTAGDGSTVIDPKDDNRSYDEFWKDETNGQKYFYLMEMASTVVLSEGTEPQNWYCSGRSRLRHAKQITYFDGGL